VTRDCWGAGWREGLGQDGRFGLWLLTKRPGPALLVGASDDCGVLSSLVTEATPEIIALRSEWES
jgi:hypothetical protein